MSESAVKAARRDLRRTIGAEGLGVVQQLQTNIANLSASVTNAHARIDQSVALANRRWQESQEAERQINARIEAFKSRSFWTRLRECVGR
jgi:hypothetical protein